MLNYNRIYVNNTTKYYLKNKIKKNVCIHYEKCLTIFMNVFLPFDYIFCTSFVFH